MEQYDTTPIENNNGCETIGELECELERLVGDIWGHLRADQKNMIWAGDQIRFLRKQRDRFLEYFDQLHEQTDLLNEQIDLLSKRVSELEVQRTANENNQDDPEWY